MEVTREVLERRAKAMRERPTRSEAEMSLILKSMGVKFIQQWVYGCYIADFYVPEVNKTIEINGSSHDGKEDYDTRRLNFFTRNGIEVLNIKNEKVKISSHKVLRFLFGKFKARQILGLKCSSKKQSSTPKQAKINSDPYSYGEKHSALCNEKNKLKKSPSDTHKSLIKKFHQAGIRFMLFKGFMESSRFHIVDFFLPKPLNFALFINNADKDSERFLQSKGIRIWSISSEQANKLTVEDIKRRTGK